MRRPSLHWWATIPAAVALVGAAVVAAQPYLSARFRGGTFFNPTTGPVGAVAAKHTEPAPAASDAHAGAAAAKVADAPSVARVASTTSRAAPTPVRLAALPTEASPALSAVGASGGMASRLGRYAATSLPLGAAGLFSRLTGSRGGALGPTLLDVSARVDAPTEIALGSVASMAPARDAADARVSSLTAPATETLSSSGEVISRPSALVALARQASAVRGDRRAALWAALPPRPRLDDHFGNVLTEEQTSAAEELLPTTEALASDAVAPVADAAPAPAAINQDLVILATPEPATIALVAGGLLLVAAARRKRAA
jgi:hypothetical protein